MKEKRRVRRKYAFQTAFTDFELGLIQCKLDSETKKNAHCIEEEGIDFLPVEEFGNNSGYLMPGKQDSCVQTILRYPKSPGTPKKVLRECIADLTKDLIELREFTTLEKQIMCGEIHPNTDNVEEQVLEQSVPITHDENELYLYSSNLIVELDEEKVKLAEKLELKIKEHTGEEKTLAIDNKKLKDELNTVRGSMIKELKSFKHKLNSVDLLSKTANEIFIIFLQTLMAKEEELIKTMRDSFEQDKQNLEDEKRQSADAEKRAMLWANELERETEKLQIDLTKRESAHILQQNRIYELEHLLKENNSEKETLKEKMETLKADLNNLQNEFDRQCKLVCRREEAIVIAQKKEKVIQEECRKRETEFQKKVNSQKETYEKRIEDLVYAIETYKTKNQELKSNIEGLEANEKQLKNIIEANALELKASNQTINKLNLKMEQLVEVHKNVNCKVQQKTSRIDEISALLKKKCEVASEYKTKLDTILPDYEILKEQETERKACIERYKEQMEVLKMEKDEQIEMIKDKLNYEEIKNIGLNKQLHELNNKNIALVEEIDILKKKKLRVYKV